VRRYLPDVDALTARVLMSPSTRGDGKTPPPREWHIVGVSAQTRNAGPAHDPVPELVVPFWQDPWASAMVAVRATDDAPAVVPDVARIIRALDPDLTMSAVMTMDRVVSDAMAADRFYSALLGAFAAVALMLAAVGIYGVMSFVVAQQTREIGVRMALGAGRGQVLVQVLREGMTTALAGTAVGGLGAWFAGRAMQGMVYGVEATEPVLFIAVALLLLGAALVACLLPARRAASVDPMVALRQD
jgi:putative ABC transport system permease protein